MEKAQLK